MGHQESFWRSAWSGNTPGMSLPCLLKSGGLIRFLRLPNGVENTRPNIGRGPDGHGMAFALSSFALVIVSGPGFVLGTLPSKLLQGIAPGLDTTPFRRWAFWYTSRSERGPAKSQRELAGYWRLYIAISVSSPISANINAERDALPARGKDLGRVRCRHASKKGVRSPYRTRQFACRGGSPVGLPGPASAAIWSVW